jgi:C-methyltransferase C-terminal domain/Putative zinc binding domain/Methyltransferase domain
MESLVKTASDQGPPVRIRPEPRCRLCDTRLRHSVVDLGVTPLANSYVHADQSSQPELFYRLNAFVCSDCFLVQLEQFASSEAIFQEYLYFSSVSESWLHRADMYAAQMIRRLDLGARSLVIEVASNDGYLLQHFQRRGIPVLGVEPAENVARVAAGKGIQCEVAFFGVTTARRLREDGYAPDLMVANNVLAHVPDLHDFVEGFRIMLPPGGVLTCEFPHLLRLLESNQFDTIYHEHLSYFSFAVVERLFAGHGMTLFDVEEVPTHGGSLRVYGRHDANGTLPPTPRVAAMKAAEAAFGLDNLDTYRRFGEGVVASKIALLEFLIGARRRGEKVLAYGAPAKGNTLLNYCGVGPELIAFTVDRSPHKQQLLLPGTRIPIRAPSALLAARPDFVLILPWNLSEEVADQMGAIRSWGGRFVVPIPTIRVF